jgi:cobalt/nickel transport system permease protein
MEHDFLDRYSGLESPVHRLDARTKVLMAVFFVLTVVSTPPNHLLAFVVYAGLLLWVAALGRVPVGFIALRAALVLPFSALVAAGLPFMGGERTVAVLGVHLSVKGLWLLAGAAMKSALGVSALVLLVSTTPLSALLAGVRRLGCPALFVDLLALTYRYLFVLVEEAMRLRRAAAARGYRPRWLPQAIIVGRLVGNLFVRSYERAERVYGAMRLRGYSSRMPAAAPSRFSPADGVVLVALILTLAVVRVFVK